MIKIENRPFFILAFLMALVVALSNYLVQFPIKYMNLQDVFTYGAFSYPVAFLITFACLNFSTLLNKSWAYLCCSKCRR